MYTTRNTNDFFKEHTILAYMCLIAKANKDIHEGETALGFGANELRDNRDRLVNKLAKKIDVNVKFLHKHNKIFG